MLLIRCVCMFSFTESDIEAMNMCFKYTVTVLTSTIAVQNERRLKKQTEVRQLQT